MQSITQTLSTARDARETLSEAITLLERGDVTRAARQALAESLGAVSRACETIAIDLDATSEPGTLVTQAQRLREETERLAAHTATLRRTLIASRGELLAPTVPTDVIVERIDGVLQ